MRLPSWLTHEFNCFDCGHRWTGILVYSPQCPKCESYDTGTDWPDNAIDAVRPRR